MIELKVTVDAPELSVAINHLADAIESKGTDAPATPVAAPMMQQPVATAAPVMTPPAAPVTQQFVPQPAAPTQSQQGITCEQIINAAMPLMNSNPAFAMQLQGILAKYGVQAVTQIPENMLPNVAADLRALGAKI